MSDQISTPYRTPFVSGAERALGTLLRRADIYIDGERSWDMKLHRPITIAR